jgi:hypothetical protein
MSCNREYDRRINRKYGDDPATRGRDDLGRTAPDHGSVRRFDLLGDSEDPSQPPDLIDE